MTTRREVIPDVLDDERIDRVVSMVADVSRARAAELVESGAVRLDDEPVTRRSSRVLAGQEIAVRLPAMDASRPVVADAGVPFDVIHADEHVVVVDKPAGVVVHPGAGNATHTLAHGLVARFPEIADVGPPERPGIVHRLDRDTSGLLVVARTTVAFEALKAAMAARLVTRRYRALVWGHVAEAKGLIDAPIARSPRDQTRMGVVVGGKEARTGYEVVARYNAPVDATELTCRLETGRTHQIRVHLQALGHPVVGDPRYGGARESLRLERQFLHAEHLAFVHPVTATEISVTSELPADLAAVLSEMS